VPLDLGRLNPPQREAVTHGGGPLLVLAGAGSGKTRVITYRIAHLLEQGLPPTAIAAVTFTNKAAEEMRERVGHLVGNRQVASKLTIGTFHALGLHILKSERKALGYPGGFVIYDQADQLGALREAMRGGERDVGDGDRRFDVKAILTRISLAKNAFVTPEAYQPRNAADDYDLATQKIYPRYQDQLRACAAFDFDDLIVAPVMLFERDAAVRERWSSRFRFVMVDEYQDTNKAQLELIRHLAPHGNLCVVGDDDQSIYGWRGADPGNILGFAQQFAGATIVKLEQNYRSTKTILAAANAVIANNAVRHGKTLWSDLAAGAEITHAVAGSVEVEAQWVAREVAKLHADGRRWSDIAVLYRSNLQAAALEDELRQAGAPYVMYGGQQFYERKEVKDVIAYLRVALNPRDDLAVRRVLNYPARGLGATTVEKLVAMAHAAHQPLWHALRGIAKTAPLPVEVDPDEITPAEQARAGFHLTSPTEDELGLRPAARTAIAQFVGVITRLAGALENASAVVAATRALVEDIKLYDDLRMASPSMSAAQRRIENVEGLLGSLARHAEKAAGRDALNEYLRRLTLASQDDKESGGDKVVMTTLHGAKGLEFPVVFIVGMEEELLPHARTLQPQVTDVIDPDHATDVSEERRLCYVGITRAQQKLYLTRSALRNARGRIVPRTPSRFLLEIPDELLEVRDLGEEARQKVPEAEVKSFFSSFALDE
jgi:superfamily I DNA/RNA helicase